MTPEPGTPEPETPDLVSLRESLGLPPLGSKLDREQSLSLLTALDAGRGSIRSEVSDWTRRVLGLPAGANEPGGGGTSNDIR